MEITKLEAQIIKEMLDDLQKFGCRWDKRKTPITSHEVHKLALKIQRKIKGGV